MKFKGMIICAFMFPGILFCTQAFAVDELYLCGTITEISIKDALVTVDVASDSCPGVRRFKLPTTKDQTSFTVANRKCFFIDSNRCKPGYIHTITKTATE